VSSVREVTVGVTPTSPRMRLQRVTGVGLTAAPRFVDSQELRADRMVPDSIETLLPSGGGSIPFEFFYPDANSPFADDIESTFYNTWVNTPTFFNDGTADSVITDAGTTTDTYAVSAGGTAVVAGHLVRATGFGNAANNQIFRAASSTGTTIVGSGLSLSAETAPAATAKLKVVGFQGASGDLVLTSTGMTSTLLNFTTLGLSVGKWLKIGGTATANRYTATVATRVQRAIIVSGGTGGTPGAVTITGTTGTGTMFQATGTISPGGILVGALTVTVGGQYTANPSNINIEPVTGGGLTGATVRLVMVNGNSNDWVRITAIAANALTFDNFPPGWVTDTGATKTIKVWFGDTIKNGTTQLTATKEIGFMDQEVPGYFQYVGLSVNTGSFSVTANERITGTFAYTGRSMTPSNVSLDDTPDAAATGRIMAAHANVGRLSEAGNTLVEPNWGNSLTFEINNNQRELLDIGSQSVAGVNPGFCQVTGTITLYMGDLSLYTKLINNVVTSLGSRWQKDNQACIFTFPHITYRGGDPQVSGPNNDITLPLSFQAAADTLTNSEVMLDRVEYFEA
jgi:hypothetical protein